MAPPRTWKDEEIEKLLDGREAGQTYRSIAEELGKTKNACIGKWHSIASKVMREIDAGADVPVDSMPPPGRGE